MVQTAMSMPVCQEAEEPGERQRHVPDCAANPRMSEMPQYGALERLCEDVRLSRHTVKHAATQANSASREIVRI